MSVIRYYAHNLFPIIVEDKNFLTLIKNTDYDHLYHYRPFAGQTEPIDRSMVHRLGPLGAHSAHAIAACCPVSWAASGQQHLQTHKKTGHSHIPT